MRYISNHTLQHSSINAVVAFCIYLASTGHAGNFPIVFLAIWLVLKDKIAFPKTDIPFTLLICTLIIIPIVGIFMSTEPLTANVTIRLALLPVSLVLLYNFASLVSVQTINYLAAFVSFEILVSTILYYFGVYSPFPFVAIPLENPDLLFQSGIWNNWKTAGLSANTSNLAFKAVILLPFLKFIKYSRLVLLVVIIGIILSGSRSGQVVLFCVILYYFFRNYPVKAITGSLAFFPILVALNFELFSDYIDFFFRGYDNLLKWNFSAQGVNRINYWFFGINHVAQHPFFGNFGYPVLLNIDGVSPNRLHSVFLQVFADYGIFTGILFSVFFFSRIKNSALALIAFTIWALLNQGFFAIFSFGDLMLFVCGSYYSRIQRSESIV